MPTTHAVRGQLHRDKLLGVIGAYDFKVDDPRVKDQLVEALAASTLTSMAWPSASYGPRAPRSKRTTSLSRAGSPGVSRCRYARTAGAGRPGVADRLREPGQQRLAGVRSMLKACLGTWVDQSILVGQWLTVPLSSLTRSSRQLHDFPLTESVPSIFLGPCSFHAVGTWQRMAMWQCREECGVSTLGLIWFRY